MPSREKTDESQSPENSADLHDLPKRLTTISRSLGLIALRVSPVRREKQVQQIHFLNSMGFDRHDIAAMLATTANTVSVALSTGSGKKKKKRNS